MNRNAQIALIVAVVLFCFCSIVTGGAFATYLLWPELAPTPTPFELVLVTPSPGLEAVPTRTPESTVRSGETSGQDMRELTPTPRVLTPIETTPTRPVGGELPGGSPTDTPTVAPTKRPAGVSVEIVPGPDGLTTEQRLMQTELPERDMRLLAERLKKIGPVPQVAHLTPPGYEVGQATQFWIGNTDTDENVQITALLRYVTAHLYVWVEEGLRYDQDALARSAERFEAQIYPTNRAFFGSEWTPGVDSDPRLHILHSTSRRMGSAVAGYYSSADQYSQLANPYSNEREMFYIALDNAAPGTAFYEGVLAHEFQHMIHWANDRNEETWWNEGCSELAAYLNGYDPGGFEWLFIADPDVQLTTWPDGPSAAANYGASYLFAAYFLGRFGEETIKQVIAHPANGVTGFDAVLVEYGLNFTDVFADWLIANYVDNMNVTIDAARFTYPDHIIGPPSTDETHSRYPVERTSSVHQYAADYIELDGSSDVRVSFAGDAIARLVPADVHSGRYAWWSNRGDDSDATLTRAFDLTSPDQATLTAWMWYDIEEDWDYAYVEVSIDGGQTWDVLAGPSSTTSNPNGNSFGPAYTGSSGGWVQEIFDLTPYAGQQILLRFECVTDDAVNQPGWLIDDLSIPELGYTEDFEADLGGWESAGFIYSDNLVAQRYLVQVIALGKQAKVLTLALDTAQTGSLELRGLGRDFDSAVLVISALAPVTTETASFTYQITPLD
ncbi:MAG: immune inhibitor A [Anaerolineae bacterium]|nr:immune inhibitor A [Anaerolineae bacterium]